MKTPRLDLTIYHHPPDEMTEARMAEWLGMTNAANRRKYLDRAKVRYVRLDAITDDDFHASQGRAA